MALRARKVSGAFEKRAPGHLLTGFVSSSGSLTTSLEEFDFFDDLEPQSHKVQDVKDTT